MSPMESGLTVVAPIGLGAKIPIGKCPSGGPLSEVRARAAASADLCRAGLAVCDIGTLLLVVIWLSN